MNGGTATEKLGLGPEVRELKFGQSFTTGKGGSFHTVRYDFKPASVDSSKMATLDVGPNNQVTISLPHSDGTGTNVFKGARKPYTKECVLIVDHVTGEVVLEKLTHTIQVKKTRQERPEGTGRGGQKQTAAPPLPPEQKKQSTSLSNSQGSMSLTDRPISKASSKLKKLAPLGNNSNSPSNSIPHRRSNSPMMSVPPRHSPLSPSPGHLSPGNGNSQNNSTTSAFDALVSKKQQKPAVSAMPSLGCIEDLLSFGNPPPMPTNVNPVGRAPAHPPPIPQAHPPPIVQAHPSPIIQAHPSPVTQIHHSHSHASARIQPSTTAPSKSITASTAILSESSSGEDSSSSSSSEASDDESSDGDMEVVPDEGGRTSPPAPSMPAVFDNLLVGMPMTKPISTASHLLSEDLQLSESGSDSDSD